MAPDSTPHGADELLTLQEAADRLKVHYMTAYRWVRRGELPAFKAGGRLRVRLVDLDAFVSAREVDVALPTGGGGRTDWPTHLDRLHHLLREGKGVEVGSLLRKVVADGAAAGEVYVRLIAPALHRIGEEWACGEITVAEEHRATEICLAAMARLSDYFRRRGPSRGTAITLTPPDEQHAVGSAMTADFLRAAGYDVHHLGASVPVEDLEVFLQVVPSDVICVSVTRPETDPSTIREIVEVVERTSGSLVVVGGQAAGARFAETGAVVVDDLTELVSVLEQL